MSERLIDDWLPIETAPTDGTPIMVKADFYTLPFIVYWGNVAEETGCLPALPPGSTIERHWLLAGLDYDQGGGLLYAPTHWKPIDKVGKRQ